VVAQSPGCKVYDLVLVAQIAALEGGRWRKETFPGIAPLLFSRHLTAVEPRDATPTRIASFSFLICKPCSQNFLRFVPRKTVGRGKAKTGSRHWWGLASKIFWPFRRSQRGTYARDSTAAWRLCLLVLLWITSLWTLN